MKKRNQDGYVLVFVLVVVLVVLALCGAACTAALRNLKSQQTSIENLQSKLGAAGEVERIYGILATEAKKCNKTLSGGLETKEEAAAKFAKDINTSLDGIASVGEITYSFDGDTLVIWIPVSATGNDSDTHVKATLKLEATLHGEKVIPLQPTESPDPAGEATATPVPTESVDPSPEPTEAPPAQETYTTWTWTLQDVKVSYDSYHVSTTESEGDSP